MNDKIRKLTLLCIFLFGLITLGFASTLSGNKELQNDSYTEQTGKLSVKGQVTDKTGAVLPGVTIVVKGTTIGTITDIDGNYSFNGIDSEASLLFSFVGMVSQEIAVNGRSSINVEMKEDAIGLDEVVAIGYGTQRKRDLTGSVASVVGKDLNEKPLTSVGEALQGKTSGVQIINAGEPGKNVTLKIRGLGTINNSDPLVVIDGFPTDLGLNSLNVSDIETVDVLKDASATAIYGARGANGVVMITTRKGKDGASEFSYTGNFGIQNAVNLPDMLNASQYAALSNGMLSNAGESTNPNWIDPSTLGVGTNWLDTLLSPAVMQNHSISFSGGSDKRHYYFSLGVLDQEGIVRQTSYRRYTFQSNNDAQVNKWIKISNNITFSTDKKEKGDYNILETMEALPTQTVKDADGTWSGPLENAYWYGSITNPIGKAEVNKTETEGYNLLANASAEISLFKGLKFKSTGGIDAKFWYTESFRPKYNWKPSATNTSEKYQSSDRSLTYLWDNYFTYDISTGKSKINAMAGTSAQNNVHKYMNGNKTDFLFDDVNQLENGEKISSLTGNMEEWSIFSLMLRVNYCYNDKYLFTATMRRDGSSRFSGDNKWGTFPSFSAAWRISEEPWFKKTKFLDNLKLRLGYGITGNQNVKGLYSFASMYKTSSVYSFNGTTVSALALNKMPNPKIHWEEVEQANLGVDINMFNQRVNLSLDGYLKYTNDMLVPMSVPVSTGYSDYDVPDINAGRMSNKGVELSLSTQNIKNKYFEWNTALNLTFNRGKILELNNNTPMYLNEVSNYNVTIESVGHPANSFYGYVTNGIFQTSDEVANYAVQEGATAAGDIRFKDLNNDGIINEIDRTYIGNPNPDFIFSLSNSLKYKDFDLDIYLYGVTGNDIYNGNRTITEGMASATNQTTATLNRWAGKGTSNSMPRAVYADPNINNRASNRWIEDGSFLRVRNITLGYTLPKRITEKTTLGTARFYLSCENLITFTQYSGLDPEIAEIDANIAGLNQSLNGLYGIDYNVYPVVRTFSVGLKVTF